MTWGNTSLVPVLYEFKYQGYTCLIHTSQRSVLDQISRPDWYEKLPKVPNTEDQTGMRIKKLTQYQDKLVQCSKVMPYQHWSRLRWLWQQLLGLITMILKNRRTSSDIYNYSSQKSEKYQITMFIYNHQIFTGSFIETICGLLKPLFLWGIPIKHYGWINLSSSIFKSKAWPKFPDNGFNQRSFIRVMRLQGHQSVIILRNEIF
jgi:hypothetical protein